ncbi:hypothetical protein [Natronomonas amylolytica]|uniref:hypothetical protein n=1 Tax=Natronomonas amylolytica TaxID=3108498 RepID=UPI00300B0849
MGNYIEAFEAFGDDELRMVSTHDATNYELQYVREDLRDAFTGEELDTAHRNLVANQVSSEDFSQAVDHGRLESQQFFFEDVLAFIFPASRYDGVLVSYDREGSIPVADVVETGIEVLD